MTDTPPIQEAFLDQLRREAVPVAVYLLSGIRLQGQIASHDQYCVALKGQSTQVILKRAISTITPQSDVSVAGIRRDEAPVAAAAPPVTAPPEVKTPVAEPDPPARPSIRLKKPRRTE